MVDAMMLHAVWPSVPTAYFKRSVRRVSDSRINVTGLFYVNDNVMKLYAVWPSVPTAKKSICFVKIKFTLQLNIRLLYEA